MILSSLLGAEDVSNSTFLQDYLITHQMRIDEVGDNLTLHRYIYLAIATFSLLCFS